MASTHASSSTSPPPSPRYAFTTLVTTDEYLPAALVVAHSLRLAHEASSGKDDGFTGVKLGPWTSNKKSAPAAKAEPPRSSNIDLVGLVTPASLSIQSIRALLRVYDRVIGVEPLGIPSILAMRQQGQITSPNDDDEAATSAAAAARHSDSAIVELSDANLSLLDRADLGASTGAALTKLHAWRLTDYAKVIYLDADTLVLRPLAHLFSHSANFAASSDTGWPDIFNSGVMLLTPSQATFEGLLNTAAQSGTWDGADQGLINEYFGGEVGSGLEGRGGGWARLPFTYNMTALGGYTYAPAYRRYGAGASVAHFIGMQKPWRTTKPPSRGAAAAARDLASGNLASKWWDVYASHYPLSGASTPVEGEVEVRFTEKGVEVIERPSAKGLDIPVYQAAWAENDDEGVQASSRSVDDLKALFQTSMGAARRGARVGEGRYESLPLFGRIDLLPPQLQKVIPAAQQKASAPSPPPQQQQQQQPDTTSAPTKRVAWDATVSSPPLDAAPSWRNAPETFYPNAWDQPSAPLTPAERAEIDRRRRLFLNPNLDDASSGGSAAARAFGYIPPEAKAIHDYQHLGGEKPDEGKVGKVFPWEKTPVKQRSSETRTRPARSTSTSSSSGTTKQSRPAATRVFPEDSAISASSSSQDRSYDRPEPLRRFDHPQQSQPQSPDLATSSGAGSGSMPVNLVERYSNVWDTLMPSLGRESEMVAQRRIASTQGREAAHEASLRGVSQQQQGQRAAGGRKTSLRGGASRGAPSGGRDTTSTGLSSTDSGTNTGTGPHPRSRQSTAGGYTSGGGHLSAATATTAAGSRYYTAQSSSDNYTDADDDSIADQYVLNRQPGGEGRGYAEVEGSASWAVPHRSSRRRPKGDGGAAGGIVGSTGTSPTGGEGPHRRPAATRRSFSPPSESGAGGAGATSSIPIPRRTSHRPRGLSEDDGDDESSDSSDDAGDSTFQEAMSTLPATGTGELGSSPGTLAVPTHSHQREGPGYTRKAMASGYARTHATPRSPRHSSHNVLAAVGVVGAVAPVAAETAVGGGADLSSSPSGTGAAAAAGAGSTTPGQGSPAAGAAPALPPLTGRARIRPEEGSVRRSGW